MKSVIKTLMSIAVCITMASCSNDQSTQTTQTQTTTQQQQGSYSEAAPDEFRQMWQNKEGKLLDVRTQGEYAEGHLPNATLIDYMGDNFKDKVTQLPKDTTYLVYCRSGRRSQMAGEEMEKMGFKVVNLKGGIMGWNNKGFEIEK